MLVLPVCLSLIHKHAAANPLYQNEHGGNSCSSFYVTCNMCYGYILNN